MRQMLILSVLLALLPSDTQSMESGSPLPVGRFSLKMPQLDQMRLANDGRHLLVASESHRVCRWDLLKRKKLSQVDLPNPLDARIALSPDGQSVIFAQINKPLRIFDATTSKERDRIPGAVKRIRTIEVSPDGTMVCTGGLSSVQIWNLRRRKVWSLPGIGKRVKQATFTQDGRYLLTQSSHALILWDLKQRKKHHTIFVAREVSTSIAISPLGKFVARNGKQAMLWKISKRKLMAERISGTILFPIRIRFLPDTQTWLIIQRGAVQLFDLLTDGPIGDELELGFDCQFAEVSRRGDRLICVDARGELGIFDLTMMQSGKVEDLQKQWERLASIDRVQAYRARWELLSRPKLAIQVIPPQLQVVPKARDKKIVMWIQELADDSYVKRETAQRRLLKQGPDLIPLVQKVLNEKLTLEVRRRLRKILTLLNRESQKQNRNHQLSRVMTVLLQMGTPEAKSFLRKLSRGATSSAITQRARAALEKWPRFQRLVRLARKE